MGVSLPTLCNNNRKRFQCLNKSYNLNKIKQKLKHYFWKSTDAERKFISLKKRANSVTLPP